MLWLWMQREGTLALTDRWIFVPPSDTAPRLNASKSSKSTVSTVTAFTIAREMSSPTPVRWRRRFCRRADRAPGQGHLARGFARRRQFRAALGDRRSDRHAARFAGRGRIFSLEGRAKGICKTPWLRSAKSGQVQGIECACSASADKFSPRKDIEAQKKRCLASSASIPPIKNNSSARSAASTHRPFSRRNSVTIWRTIAISTHRGLAELAPSLST